MKIFKCVLWAGCQILDQFNKAMSTKETRHDLPFIIETKYIEIESYEKLQKTYKIAPLGCYCLIEEVESLPKKDAIEVSKEALKVNPEGA